ncbi:MAG TPA: META domain-containing protein [Chitinophagaceae bacterium]|nr:META domain-containing protein [Chitinophagaceae bacterium]
MKSLIAFTTLFMSVFSSCCTTNQAKSNSQHEAATPLYNTKWLLKKISKDGALQDVNTNAFIRFDKEKNSAGGNGSCNSFGSTTKIDGQSVNFSNTFSTKMFCHDVQSIEDSFFGLLEKVTRYEISGNQLKLFQDNAVVLEFVSE